MVVKSKKIAAGSAAAKKKVTREGSAAFVTDDSRAACEHFEAQALAALARKATYNADLDVVPHNVELAVSALEPQLARNDVSDAERKTILELRTLVLALVYADSRCVEASSPKAIADAQSTLRPLRQATLSYLEAVSSEVCGLVPAERVRAIREGKGQVDEARDAVTISAVFKEFAAQLDARHPFTAAQLATLEAKGVFLLRALAPTDAAAPKGPSESSQDEKLRDGLWTLIVEGYDCALLVAAKAWGVRRVHEHVPALLARAASEPKSPPPAT